MAYKFFAICTAVVTIQGCAFGTRNVTLTYPLEKGDDVVHAAENATTIGVVAVQTFQDGRDNRVEIGEVRNGWGMRTAVAVAENNVIEWVMYALEYELNAQGIETQAATGAEGELLVGGELLTVFCTAMFSYEGTVSFIGTIDKDGEQVARERYTGKGTAGMNMAATAKSYGKSLTDALSMSIKTFASDIRQALEVGPE